MADKQYLSYKGLQDVAGHVNTRLKTVTTIPASADDGAVRLYVGETGVTYKKGHIYQYNATDLEWVDITSSSEYIAGNGIDITDDEISVETYIFTGTQAQWDALTTEQKKEYDICNITDDASSDDEIYTKSEIDTMLGTDYQKKDLETAIEGATTVEGALGALSTNKATQAEVNDMNNVLGAKNLTPSKEISQTKSEVTFTVDSDGVVTLNGTSNNTIFRSIISNNNAKNIKIHLKKGTYTYSLCDTEITGVSLVIKDMNGQDILRTTSIRGANFTLSEDKDVTIDWRIESGTTFSNTKFKAMIRLASDPDNTYVPYAPTNAKLNEEKMSYADNGILGAKNLLKNTATSQTINNVAFTVNSNDKTVNVTRTAEQTEIATRDLYVVSDEDYKLLAGKTLLMTGCPSGGSNNTYYLECYYNDGTGHWLRDIGDGLTITLPATKPTTIKFLIGIKVASVIPSGGLTFKPMIRLASDPDDTYQPHAMTNRELTEKVNALPREVFVTTDTRTTTTNDANTLPCGFTRMNDLNSNLPTDGTGGSVWYDILTVRQSNNSSKETWGYGFQLAVQTTTNANMGDMYVRAVNGGATPSWSVWRKLN